jgi:hypothetical protein
MKRLGKMKRVRKMKRVSEEDQNQGEGDEVGGQDEERQQDPWEQAAQNWEKNNHGWPSWNPPPPPQAQVEVLVNQEGSLDLQPSRSCSPHVEFGQEAQSMERNDIELIHVDNPSKVLEWVAPFDSIQLRSLHAAAIPLSQSGNWCFTPSSSTPTLGQLLHPSPDQEDAVAQQGSHPNSLDDSSKRNKRKLTPMSISGKHIPLTEFPYNLANL